MKMYDADIRTLDLECVSYKVCRDEGWPLEKVDRVERAYRAFLQIIRDVDGAHSVAPTLDIDRYWHHHILDTQIYHRDCAALFGRYLHHFPYSGIFVEEYAKQQNERVHNTLSLLKPYIT